jgi:hypothetical protein
MLRRILLTVAALLLALGLGGFLTSLPTSFVVGTSLDDATGDDLVQQPY